MADDSQKVTGGKESWIGRGGNALQRSFGNWGIIAMVISGIGLAYSGLIPLGQAAGQWAGNRMEGVVALGMLMALMLAYLFAAIGALVGRPGSDYVLSSRVFGGRIGFAASWVWIFFCCFYLGKLAAFIPQTLLPAFNRSIQFILAGSASDLVEATPEWLRSAEILVSIGAVAIIIAYLSMMVPPRTLSRLIFGGFITAMVGMFVVLVIGAFAPPESFAIAWDHAYGIGTYDHVILNARNIGMVIKPSLNTSLMGGLLAGVWILFGSFLPAAAAGEARKPDRSLLIGGLVGVFIAGANFISGSYFFQYQTTPEWLAAQSYLAQNAADYNGVTYIFQYVLLLIPNMVLAIFLLITWIVAMISMMQVFFFFTSRTMLAWADDGLLLDGMDYVHPRYRSPLLTMLVVAILALGGLVDALLGGVFVENMNIAVFGGLGLLLPVVAMTVLPFRRPQWFENAPGWVKLKIGPIPVVTVVGSLMTVYLLAVVVTSFFVPGNSKTSPLGSLIVYAVMFAAGAIWYQARRGILRARKVKLDEHFKSLADPR